MNARYAYVTVILSNKIYQTFQDLSKQNSKNNIENKYIYYEWSIFHIHPVTFYIYVIKMSDISRFIYLSICGNRIRLPNGTGLPATRMSSKLATVLSFKGTYAI
jgi:hypothetical protein